MKRKRQSQLVEDLTPRKRTTRQGATKSNAIHIKKENVEDIVDEDVDSSSDTEEICDYEKKRLENIRRNEEMLRSLNLKQYADDLKMLSQKNPNKTKSPNISYTPRAAPKRQLAQTPTRRSLRIEMKSKDETLQTQFYSPVVTMKPEREKRPPGPIDMVPYNDIEDKESHTFLNNLALNDVKVKKEKIPETETVEKYKESISKLRVLPKNVAKIVPRRVYSMTFHPSSSRPIVCAGDKSGSIGFWDVDAKRENNNGIFIYDPHVNAVTSVSFQPEKDNKLYTSSYDGSVRCADFNTCVFDEVYSIDDYTGLTHLSYLSCDVLLVSRTDGKVVVVDTRAKKDKYTGHNCHIRAVKCVHCCPTNSNLFCTSSADASVALWDIRRMKGIKSKLGDTRLGRSVSSAYFSPITGKQILTTSFDDTVCLFDVSASHDLERKRNFKHFNQTGRWLTPFKANWDPKNDCGFVVGSMKPIRRFPRYSNSKLKLRYQGEWEPGTFLLHVDVYHSEQKNISPIVELFDANFATITSINAFHPTKSTLASGNSSGKVYVWTKRGN